MTKGARILLILLSLGLAGWFLFPTVQWYFFTSEEKQDLANASMSVIREYAEEQAAEDLDAIIELSNSSSAMEAEVPQELAYLADQAEVNYELLNKRAPKTWILKDLLGAFSSGNDVFRAMESHYREDILSLKDMKNRTIQLGLDLFGGINVVIEADEQSLAERLIARGELAEGEELTAAQRDEALSLAMEILNNRIDEFGVTEPQIRKLASENQIIIDVPGVDDPERVNQFLMGKGSLGFYIVDDEATDLIQNYVDAGGRIVDGRPLDNDLIDVGLEVRGFYKKDEYNADVFQDYYVTTASAGLDGGHIKSAQVIYDQVTGEPYVIFTLDSEGGDIFFSMTSANEGRTMAVVMDDKIKAAARISEPIRDQVRITGFDQSDAQALALVLRTAALPVDLEVKSQNSVGASLGEDTIKAGLNAIAIGLAAVVLFMAVWYRRAGLIADLALILNFIFIMAILSALKLTLTMTSIAGIILNVGMAVDANVIIFERIKEELRLGKTRAAAVEGGFRKAFWTIMDANITTFIAALFLSMLGSGPVQGFALTLAVGIVSSLFTAIFVSRYFFDLGTDLFKKTKLHIGWGIK